MIRLLVLGDRAAEWTDRVRREGRGRIEVEGVRRPAAGIRKLEAWSPDVVAVAEPAAARQGPMVEAVRARPLGRLVPVILLGDAAPSPDLEVDEALGGGASVERLHRRMQRLLGEDVEETLEVSNPAIQTDSAAGAAQSGAHSASPSESKSAGERDYVIEPIDEQEEAGAAGGGGSQVAPMPVRPSDIERKLKEVRHRDYFGVLEVARGASEEAVRDEYRQLKRQFRPDRLDPAVAREYEQALDEINEAFDDAVAVLADEQLRDAYLDRTTRK